MKFLSWIVHVSLNNRPIVLVFTLFFVFFGIRSAFQIKMDAVPDVTTIQVQVITTVPSLSPSEMEQFITYPIERVMSGLPYLTEMRSISRAGISVVTLVFRDDIDVYFARQVVNERLQDATKSIPQGLGSPTLGPISTGLGEVYQFVIEGDGLSTLEKTTLLNWYINPLLKQVPGVVEVNSFGGQTKQIQVLLNPEKMQALKISLYQVADALQKNNAGTGSGYIEHNGEAYTISSVGLFQSISDIKKTFIGKTSQGFPILIEDIGEVKEGYKLRLGASSQDGLGETVGAMALMLTQENALKVCMDIQEKVNEIQKSLPSGIKIRPFYDRSELVTQSIKTALMNLIEGAVLVILVLFLFLRNIRAGLAIASVIPLCMLFAIIIMNLRNAPANLMSLGAIDFGLVVDGAVIIIENAIFHIGLKVQSLGRNLTHEEKIQTIEDATIEVRQATLFGEIIIASVYFPILALSGTEGKMFHPMALTVIYALAGAFLFSLTVVPVLASFLLKTDSKEEHIPFLSKLESIQSKYLNFLYPHHGKIYTSLIILLLLVGYVFSKLGSEFLPELDEGTMLLEVSRLPSTALSSSVSTSHRIEKALMSHFPEVKNLTSKTGSPDIATDPMGIERTDIYLELYPKSTWRLSKADMIEEMLEVLKEDVPETSPSVSMPIKMRTNELIAGIRSDIGIKIFGPDSIVLIDLGEKISQKIREIKGVRDLKIEQWRGLNQIRIYPDRNKLARYGLSIQDINQTIESVSSGHFVSHLLDGNKRFEIVVKSEINPKNDPELWKKIPVRFIDGSSIPLGDLGMIRLENGPTILSHEGGARRLLVEFNIRERDMMSTVEEVQKTLEKDIKLPVGYHIEYGGKYKNYLSARSTLMIVVPVTIGIIVFLLYLAFHEIITPLFILANIPFSIIGGVLFLFIRGIPFSISSAVGFIALFGVAVLNGLVLLSYTKHLEETGLSHHDAIFQAAHRRLRPVLMTASVAIIGFIPMALSTSVGAEVQRPLATVVIGGLITSAIMTLVILPILYSKFQSSSTKKSPIQP
jgi:cobalt-zinc-cadmium resistance protein CzcA